MSVETERLTLSTRVVIEQVKGAVSARFNVDMEEAFEWTRSRAPAATVSG